MPTPWAIFLLVEIRAVVYTTRIAMLKSQTINKHVLTADLRDVADESVWNEITIFREYRIADEVIKNAQSAILDVGAHAGFFSLYARVLNPKVTIIALEPESKNILAIKSNLARNSASGVIIESAALSAVDAPRQLLVTKDTHNHRLVDQKYDKTVTVPGITLKDLMAKHKIKKFNLLKMDIEGGEYELFSAWDQNDFASIEAIVMEYHILPGLNPDTIEQKLRENGFGVRKFPSKFDKTMGFFFATNKRLWKHAA